MEVPVARRLGFDAVARIPRQMRAHQNHRDIEHRQIYALAAAGTRKQAPQNTSSLRAEQYARRAVALLRQAAQKGFRDIAHLKKDTDLDGLRQRTDFQQVLVDLEAKAPGK